MRTIYPIKPNSQIPKSPNRNCGHIKPVVRNVIELEGAAAYICRGCFAYLRAIEVKAVVRRQVAALFGKLWPLGLHPGAIPIAAGRGAT